MSQPYQIGDYAETYRTFRLDVPERYNWAYDVFDRWGEDPQKLAMLWVSAKGVPRQVTFRALGERSRRVANALAGLGATPGDRVFIMLPRALPTDVRLGHPSGVLPINAAVEQKGGRPWARQVTVYRTARRLMEGFVRVP